MPEAGVAAVTEQTEPLPIEALKCGNCGKLVSGPRDICPTCHEPALVPHTAPGTGALSSWTMIRRPPAAFREEKEYAVAVVALDAGIKVTGRLETPDDRLEPGARVLAIGFHKGVPVFRAV
jgi:uncharacterized OB-fold protein